MKKMLCAALLAACAMPANAWLKIEAIGRVQIGSSIDPYYEFGDLLLTGYCWGPCNMEPYGSSGFKMSGSYGHHAPYYSFHFTFADQSSWPTDDFRSGSGEWLYTYADYFTRDSYYKYGNIISVRAYEDGVVDFYNYSYFPEPVITNIIRVGVPEPVTWAMMIGGFAMAGGMMRRRPRAQVAFS